MNKKKKVLFFLFGNVGGAERMTINIAKMLPKEEYEYKFVVCGQGSDILKFIPDGCEVIRIPWRNIYMFSRLRIARIIFMEKPDYVFASTMSLNVRLIQAAKWLHVRSIVRNDNNLCYVGKDMHKKLAKYYPDAYHVIAQQEEMQHDIINLIGTDDKHVVALPNPIDTKLIDSKLLEGINPYPNDDAINYLWIANFLPAKGHDILINAFKEVHKVIPNAHLYLLGGATPKDGDLYRRVEGYVDKSGVSEFIHIIGFQSNPYCWMKHASCFVLPSRMEGLPNVLIEAMYCGSPVVATKCIPVIDRIVEEGFNGYKVPTEDSESMAAAMMKAIHLKDFHMTYKSATKEDFINLFK